MVDYIKVADRTTGETAVGATANVKTEVDSAGKHWQKMLVGLIPPHDYFVMTYPSDTKEVVTYYSGGTFDGDNYTGGSITGIIHTTYIDNTKAEISKSGRVL